MTFRGDMLPILIEDMNTQKFLTGDSVAQLMFAYIFVTFGSICMVLSLVLKFLEENPRALQEITVCAYAFLQLYVTALS